MGTYKEIGFGRGTDLRFVLAPLLSLALCLPTTAYPEGGHGGSSHAYQIRVAAANDAASVFRRASPSVVVVHAFGKDNKKAQGSGVIFDSDTSLWPGSWVVSNAHVVRGAAKVIVSQSTKRFDAVVEYYDSDLDLAILRISGVRLTAAPVRGAADIDVGTAVFAIGSPLGLENSITEGVVSGRRIRDEIPIIQTSAAISPGSSGGGLFDSNGQLIAVTTFQLKGGENLNFAVDASFVYLLKEAVWIAGAIRSSVADSLAPEAKSTIESNTFIHWLLRAIDADGAQLYVRARKTLFDGLKERNKPGSEGWNALDTRLREFAQLFLTQNQVRTERDVPSNKQGEASSAVELVCILEFQRRVDGRTERHEGSLTIDYRQRTVNGIAADISDSSIRWNTGEQGEFSNTLNRYTGATSVHTRQGSSSGKCVPAGQRQF
jgi:hypothetical protein